MLNRKKESPRGVLHVADVKPMMGLERFEASQELRPFIEHYWSVTWVGEPRVLRETVPHPSVHLVFELNATQLHGIHQRRFSRWIEGTGRVLGVKFLPGGFRGFTTYSLKELTNTIVHPSKIFGPSIVELESEVVGIASAERGFEKIDAYLRQLNPKLTPDIEVVNRMVRLIADDRSITRAEMLAEKFGIGLRSLQRLFAENVGVSPKWVIQRHRLIEAAERIRESMKEIDFADLALELGYADQSHFIRDFKIMVGLSPAKYRDSLNVANRRKDNES